MIIPQTSEEKTLFFLQKSTNASTLACIADGILLCNLHIWPQKGSLTFILIGNCHRNYNCSCYRLHNNNNNSSNKKCNNICSKNNYI